MKKHEKIYNFFVKLGNSLQSPFLLLIRLIWGFQFLIAGYGKLINLQKVAGFFEGLNIFFPKFSAFSVGSFETLGGICLILGLASRLITIPLMVIIITAYTLAHSVNLTFFSFAFHPIKFANEAPFGFLYTVLVIFIFGPGKFSFDALIGAKKGVNK